MLLTEIMDLLSNYAADASRSVPLVDLWKIIVCKWMRCLMRLRIIRTVRWVGNVAYIEEMRNPYKINVANHEVKREASGQTWVHVCQVKQRSSKASAGLETWFHIFLNIGTMWG
jgi:hypothetical protein